MSKLQFSNNIFPESPRNLFNPRRTLKLDPDELKNLEQTKTNLVRKLSRLTLCVPHASDQDELVINDDKHLHLIFNILMKKEGRSFTENQLMLNYLKTMTGFVEMIKKAFNGDTKLVNEILAMMSFFLGYEKYEKNSLLFKIGDKGEKFYIILKGSVDILMAKEETVRITEIDYLTYLAALKKYDEIELFNECLVLNLYNYGIEIDDLGKYQTNSPDIRSPRSKRSSKKHSYIKKVSIFTLEDLNDKLSVNSNESFSKREKGSRLRDNQFVFATHISTIDYINRLKVYKNYETESTGSNTNARDNSKVKLIQVAVFQYHCVASLYTGQKFGDIALDNSDQKRTATIITREDTHLGILNKDCYKKCIKEVNEKSRRQNLNFILNNNLFLNVNKITFNKKYSNFFVNLSVNRGEKLIVENDQIPAIYLIKNGEYDITMYKSYFDITEILKQWDKKISMDPLYGKSENQRCIIDKEFKKYYHQKRVIRVSIIQGKDTVGLEDYFVKGKSAISVECTSAIGDVIKLEYNFFQTICQKITSVKEQNEHLKSIKKNIILEKLRNIREINLSSNRNLNDFDNIGNNNKTRNNFNFVKPFHSHIERLNNKITSNKQKLGEILKLSDRGEFFRNMKPINLNIKTENDEKQDKKTNNLEQVMSQSNSPIILSKRRISPITQENVNTRNLKIHCMSKNESINNLDSIAHKFSNENMLHDNLEKTEDLSLIGKENNDKKTFNIDHMSNGQTSTNLESNNIHKVQSHKISPIKIFSINDKNKNRDTFRVNNNIKKDCSNSNKSASRVIKLRNKRLKLPMSCSLKLSLNHNNKHTGGIFNETLILSTLHKNLYVNKDFFLFKQNKDVSALGCPTNRSFRNRIFELDKVGTKSRKDITNINGSESNTTRSNNVHSNLHTDLKKEDQNINSYLSPANSSRILNQFNAKEKDLIALNSYYFQPTSLETVDNCNLNTNYNNDIDSTMKETYKSNDNNKVRLGISAGKLMNSRAKILFGIQKMQSLRLQRYSDDINDINVDNFKFDIRKTVRNVKKKEELKLTKTMHNMFRFTKYKISNSNLSKKNIL